MSKYRFEMYERGEVAFVSEVFTEEQAREFYMANYNSSSAIRLFINDEKMSYLDIPKLLDIPKNKCIDLFGSVILPHAVRG